MVVHPRNELLTGRGLWVSLFLHLALLAICPYLSMSLLFVVWLLLWLLRRVVRSVVYRLEDMQSRVQRRMLDLSGRLRKASTVVVMVVPPLLLTVAEVDFVSVVFVLEA
jgi:hypothetical protein